jgi:hypothetical protein
MFLAEKVREEMGLEKAPDFRFAPRSRYGRLTPLSLAELSGKHMGSGLSL